MQDCLILQEDLDSLSLWEADWQVKFKVAKCHSMRVSRHYSLKQILQDCTLHQQNLENIQSANILAEQSQRTWIGVNISLIFIQMLNLVEFLKKKI